VKLFIVTLKGGIGANIIGFFNKYLGINKESKNYQFL
jgi:hypothetical protein